MIDHWLQELDFSYYSRCKQVRCVTGWSEKVASSMTWCKLLRSNLECSQSLWMEKPSSTSTQLLRQLKGSPKLFCASVDKEETDLLLQNAFVFRWQPPSMHQDTWEDLLQNLSCIIFSAQWLHCAVRRGTRRHLSRLICRDRDDSCSSATCCITAVTSADTNGGRWVNHAWRAGLVQRQCERGRRDKYDATATASA